MSDHHQVSNPGQTRAVRGSLTFSLLAVLVGICFIVLDTNGTRPIGVFVVAVAGELAVAAAAALRKLRRLE